LESRNAKPKEPNFGFQFGDGVSSLVEWSDGNQAILKMLKMAQLRNTERDRSNLTSVRDYCMAQITQKIDRFRLATAMVKC